MMAGPVASLLDIVAVTSPAEFERFVRLPHALNAGDPNWRAPLLMERREALSPKHNPFFEHAEVQFWLATRGGRDVGRISAQIDRLSPPTPAGRAGHFGLIAAEDDGEVFAALLATAEAWLAERGCVEVLGPFNLGINEEIGLLVEGADTPPMIMMGHDPAHAGRRIEAAGYAKARDVYAYLGDTMERPPAIDRMLASGVPEGMSLRPVDMARFDAEVMTMVDIFNDAWAENWGFAPLTVAETRHLAKSLKLVLEPRLVWFVEIAGRPVGFGVALPNINEAAADLGGRLAPFGWAKLLWRLKVSRKVTGVRLLLMGFRRGYARGLRDASAPFLLLERMAREAAGLGYSRYEISWILEDNRPACRMAEALGARRYKTYRLYGKSLAAPLPVGVAA